MENYLTQTSLRKFQHLKNISIFKDDLKCDQILNSVKDAFIEHITIVSSDKVDPVLLRRKFIDWNEQLNGESLFDKEVESLNRAIEVNMRVKKSKIRMFFLYAYEDREYVSILIHAVNTFFHIFNTSDDLNLYICLNRNERSLMTGCKKHTECIHHMRKNSLAMSVSGTTNISTGEIYLTRKEEITKLLFHELIHFFELDSGFRNDRLQLDWDIEDQLVVYEAYTEFLSVVINSAYLSCHLQGDINMIFKRILSREINYSVFLCATILKFYGYNNANYTDFFKKKIHSHKQPIYLWEYIFVRTQLMLCINDMMRLICPSYSVNKDNYDQIMNIITNDEQLIESLSNKHLWNVNFDSASYLLFDIDWNRFNNFDNKNKNI